MNFDRVFAWGNNEKRATMKGRACRVVAHGTRLRSCLIEFENGQREIVSQRSLRLAPPEAKETEGAA